MRSTGRVNGLAWSALLVATAAAWAVTIARAGGMPAAAGTMGQDVVGFLGLWTAMMTAMMLPSVAPVAALYLRSIRTQAVGARVGLRGSGFVAGYLVAWTAVGLAAYALTGLAGSLVEQAPRVAPWVAAGLLLAAGLYQLTPLKERCLAHCRSPISLLMHVGAYRGRLRDLHAGLYHGAYCVGCCWGLMVVLIAVGLMNLVAMVALAVVILLEKTWRHGVGFGFAVGAALIVFALLVPWHPTLVPGLTAREMGGMPAKMP